MISSGRVMVETHLRFLCVMLTVKNRLLVQGMG